MSTQGVQATNPTTSATGNAGSNSQFASLYVGDLVPEVSEDVLYQVFNTVGPVASIRVCRDSVTRRSLGYAYVNFHSVQDAERALDTLNFSNIKGHPCRIMWSHRDPASRKSSGSNVFVKNLDKSIDNKALHDTFCLFGNILSCKVAQDPDGKSRGFGFVHFESEDAAKIAIDKLNGMKIGQKTVFVGLFQKHADREDGTPKQFTNVYMKHIPDSWTEEQVKQALEDFGAVTSFVLKTDPKGRRFAFANYEEFDQAKACVDSLHGKDLRTDEEKAKFEHLTEEERETLETEKEDDVYTYQLYCTRAQNKSERQAELKAKFHAAGASTNGAAGPNSATSSGVIGASAVSTSGNNLYIKNLSETVSDEELKVMFEAFGPITSAKIMRDEKGESRCFGFVCYVNAEDATRAVTEMHLKLVNGKPLYVGLHEKREQRLERLQNRFRMGGSNTGAIGNAPQSQYIGAAGGAPGMGMPASMRQGMFPGSAGGFPRQPMPMMGGATRPPMMHPSQMMQRGPMGGPAGGFMMNPRGVPMGGPRPNMQPMMGGMQQRPMMVGGGAPGGVPMRMPNPMMHPGVAPQMQRFPPRAAPQMDMAQFDPSGPLTAAALAAAPPALQKQMLGEKLFPAIARLQPELAGKITGMMLEMDNSELLILLESEQQLRYKVDEALRVLQG